MLGQMMLKPLLISSLIDHAEKYHGGTPIASVETAGGIVYKTWAEVAQRAHQLASALDKLGIKESTCCATLAWNNHRHLEIYFGVSGGGNICHTINPRLFPAQLAYIINHAKDKILFFDKTFLPLVLALKDKLETVEHYVLLSPPDAEATAQFPSLVFYEDLIATGDLGRVGHRIAADLLTQHGLEIPIEKLTDCGILMYKENQPVFAGGSGCACVATTTFGHLLHRMQKGQLQRILVIATGALLSPMSYQQKETIPCIAYAVSIEM